jgi:hypothetical protein
LQADAAQYAALEKEMSEPDPTVPDDLWSRDFRADDGGEPARQEAGTPAGGEAQDGDAERQARIKKASEEADQWLDQLEAGQQTPAPSVDDDPVGVVKLLVQQDQERQFWGAVMQSEAQIRQTKPDYDEATTHLEAGRVAELERIYADDNPRAIAFARQHGLRSVAELRTAMLNQDRIAVSQQAFALGIPPAELYYSLAVQRGYQPKAAGQNGQQRGRSTGRARGKGGFDVGKLADLYLEDGDAFDKEWDRYAAAMR